MHGNLNSSFTMDILGLDNNTYRKWIESEMNPDMNWNKIDIDHVAPVYSFDVSDDEEL